MNLHICYKYKCVYASVYMLVCTSNWVRCITFKPICVLSTYNLMVYKLMLNAFISLFGCCWFTYFLQSVAGYRVCAVAINNSVHHHSIARGRHSLRDSCCLYDGGCYLLRVRAICVSRHNHCARKHSSRGSVVDGLCHNCRCCALQLIELSVKIVSLLFYLVKLLLFL